MCCGDLDLNSQEMDVLLYPSARAKEVVQIALSLEIGDDESVGCAKFAWCDRHDAGCRT